MNATKYILPIVLMSAPAMAQEEMTLTAGTPKRDNSNDVLRTDITGVINDLQFARNGVVELYRGGQIHQQQYQRLLNSLLKTQKTLSDLYPARVFARAAEYEQSPVEQALYEARIACIDLALGLVNNAKKSKSAKGIDLLEEVCAEKVAVYEAAKERLYNSDRTKPQNVAANTFNERNIFSGSLEAGVDTDDQFYVGFVGGWNFAKNGLRKLELLVGGRVYTNGAGENSPKTITQGNPDGSSSKLERDVTTTNIDVTGDLRVRYLLGDSDSFYSAPVTGVRGHITFSNGEIDATSSFTTPSGDVTVIPLNTEESSTVQTSAGFFIGVDGCYSNICVTPEIELQKGGKDIKAGAGVKYQF